MRIQQNSEFLLTSIRRVEAGALAPAAFQRPYVWTKDDVLALCESVLSGFPLGGFLTWVPVDPQDVLPDLGRSRLGPISLQSASRPEGCALLLDGQNRLATLAWLLQKPGDLRPADLSGVEQETWGGQQEVVLDLTERCFEWVDAADVDAEGLLPAWTVLRSGPEVQPFIRQKWNEWEVAGVEDIVGKLTFFDRACDAFRDARVTETVLRNASVEEARRAFKHICKVGVSMSAADFDEAVGWQPVPNRRASP